MSITKVFTILLVIIGILFTGCSQQINKESSLQTPEAVINNEKDITGISTTDQGTVDNTKYDYSSFQGQWYSPDDINFETKPYLMELSFKEDGKTAEIHITAYGQDNQKIDEYYTTTFDYSSRGRFTILLPLIIQAGGD